MKRIQDKIKEIETYIAELQEIIPQSIQEYTTNFEKKAACERYIERIVEAIVDLSFIMIKLKRYRIPEDDPDAFTILFENKIISKRSMETMKDAKGMRNIIAHQYGKVDDKIIFDSLTKELSSDVTGFLKEIKKLK